MQLPAGYVPVRDFGGQTLTLLGEPQSALGAAYDLLAPAARAQGALPASAARNRRRGEPPGVKPGRQRSWADANGNYVPDCDLQDRLANGEWTVGGI